MPTKKRRRQTVANPTRREIRERAAEVRRNRSLVGRGHEERVDDESMAFLRRTMAKQRYISVSRVNRLPCGEARAQRLAEALVRRGEWKPVHSANSSQLQIEGYCLADADPRAPDLPSAEEVMRRFRASVN